MRKDVKYVFMFHWLTSTHMIIRENAFDHFDAVLCPGPYQIAELREAEQMYQTPEKELVDSGYGLVEQLVRQYEAMEHGKHDRPQILIGPSWQPENIMDSVIDVLLDQLLDRGYQIIVRPHPEYIKRFPTKISNFQQRYNQKIGRDFILDLDFSSNAVLYESDILLTDWSSVGYEFAFSTLKPILFIDTPPKVNNPNYINFPMQPLDITLRTKVGRSLRLDELGKTSETVSYMLRHGEKYRKEILASRQEVLPQFGHSGEICGQYILSKLIKQKKQNSNGAR